MSSHEALKTALATLIKEANAQADEQQIYDFVFHLIESTEDLCRFAEFARSPDAFSPDDGKAIVRALLYHASGHIAQAARLYDYFPDPFGRAAATGIKGNNG